MDWLNVLLGLHQRFGVEIPESDYGGLGTLTQIVDYLAKRVR
jgi:acyl carrier protein